MELSSELEKLIEKCWKEWPLMTVTNIEKIGLQYQKDKKIASRVNLFQCPNGCDYIINHPTRCGVCGYDRVVWKNLGLHEKVENG